MTTIDLPRDAEGREIPLSTKMLYRRKGGSVGRINVSAWRYDVLDNIWSLIDLNDAIYFHPEELLLIRPDTWGALLQDLDECAKDIGVYAGCDNECIGADIAARIRKLRGERDD